MHTLSLHDALPIYLIEPYVRNCLLDRRMSEASDAMALAGKIIKPVKNTILYNDLEKLRAEID